MFEFISSYQGVFDYRRARGDVNKRWRVDHTKGNRLTVGYEKPTPAELEEFRAWQIAEHKRTMQTMISDPKRYPPEFYTVTESPRLLASEESA